MITVVNDGGSDFVLFYASSEFAEGLDVTGYVIYTDLQKSKEYEFSPLGDGIYASSISIRKTNKSASEKYGVVVKENGEVKEFDIVQIVH